MNTDRSDARILVIGATGTIGNYLVSALSEKGVPFRVIARNPDKLPHLNTGSQPGVIIGDVTDKSVLVRALDGIDKVFLLYPDSADRGQKEGGIISEISNSDVKHVVKLSAYCAATQPPMSFGVSLSKTDQLLQHSGKAWTILRPYALMQNILKAESLIRGLGFYVTPFAGGRVAYIDANDVARVATQVLLEDGHNGKVYTLSGPEAVSRDDIANSLSNVLQKKVRFFAMPNPILRFVMRRQGVSAWEVARIYELAKMLASGGEEKVDPTFEMLCAEPPRNVDAFLRANMT